MTLINKYILPIFFFLIFSESISSQNKTIDSLQQELTIHKQLDTVRVNILNRLAYLYYSKNLDTTTLYTNESERISKKIGFKKGNARSLYIKGVVQAIQSNYKQGFQYFNEAVQLYTSINYKKGIATCYYGMGLLKSNAGDQNQAIVYYKQSIKVNEEIGNEKGISSSLNNIGTAYDELGNYTEAITYFEKALNINKKINNTKRIADCLSNIGNIYSNQGNHPLALEYYNKGLLIEEQEKDSIEISNSLNNIGILYKKMENYDKAITIYKKALKIQKKNINKKSTAEILNNLGLAYKGKKEYKKAHEYLKKGLEIGKQIKNKAYIGTFLNNIGDVYLALKEDKVAYPYFKKAKENNIDAHYQLGLCNSYLGIATILTNQKKYNQALINALKSKEISDQLKLINYQRDVQKLLTKIYSNTSNYKKALESQQKFKLLNDSIFNKKNIEKITQLEYEYKYKHEIDAANIRELKLTKTVKSTSQDLEKSQRNLLLGVIAFLIISLILGTTILFLKLRNETSKTQNILIEQKLLRSQMTPHFIFNSLSVLQGMILNKEEKSSITYLSKFSKLLRTILENSRHKTVSLSDELFAIDSYMALQNLDITPPYDYSLIIAEAIDQEAIKIPPMLIQPFIENAIEHAFPNKKEAKKIDVHLVLKDEKLICTISDNGIGINTEQQKNDNNKNSLATTITSERLKMLSKDFKIQGSVTIKNKALFGKQGTLVTLVIPYKTTTI